jgi:anion-transporting  ArsA/GET3 family ATPase
MVTGKGGVGKSVIAASLALKFSKQGKKVLLVEVSEQSYYSLAFNLQLKPQVPVRWQGGVDIVQWTGVGCLREYIRYLIKIDRLADLFFDNRVMQTFIRAAPALKEIAILGKLTSAYRHVGPSLDYDIIVFDGYSTGHYLALLQSPIGLGDLVDLGPMGRETRSIIEVLKNPKKTTQIIVTLPEALPTEESLELHDEIKKILSIDAMFVLNKMIEHKAESEWLERAKNEALENAFAAYIQNKIIEQKKARGCIEQKSKSITPVDMVFNNSIEQVVKQIALQLEGA